MLLLPPQLYLRYGTCSSTALFFFQFDQPTTNDSRTRFNYTHFLAIPVRPSHDQPRHGERAASGAGHEPEGGVCDGED